MKPIFVFSLPRSGSTLLQRILGGHPEIVTTSEPWILLPFLYVLKESGLFSEYGHSGCYKAVGDFFDGFPNGKDDYLKEVNCFTKKLYQKYINNEEKYFVDKTPRYSLIVDEIITTFPEAKVIFLWRNPLAIISSIIDTWGGGGGGIYIDFMWTFLMGLKN